ncbi:sulfite exporter TauE/SafE family protein [candidate division KSB1 bacterium]
MNLSIILILVLIGLVAGIFSGFVGLGGGIILIPALIFFMGMSQHAAQGTSLGVMLPPIGLFAAYNYYKAGHLNFKFAFIIAAAFLIGGYFGSKIALNIPVETMKKAFGIILILVALHIIFNK